MSKKKVKEVQQVLPPRNNKLTHIIVRGARVHNLKNIDVSFPRNQMIVITGLSGSGKSSLAFDTLYAEGQRRYVESLSSYARQFLGRLNKPDVDSISGISPAVAIEQKVTSRTSRSTVGTTTEIYDYFKLLFSRIGKTYSPVSGAEVKRHRPSDVCDYIASLQEGTRLYILAPINPDKGETHSSILSALTAQGFVRVLRNGNMESIEEATKSAHKKDELMLVIDRITASREEENLTWVADSAESAFLEGKGKCVIRNAESPFESRSFSNRFEADGITFDEPSVHLFSFNNPIGACKTCEGFGSVIGIDENLVVPDKRLSIFQDAVVCWKGEKMSEWKKELVMNASKFSFPIHKPWNELTEAQRDEIWNGNAYFGGLHAFFRFLESESYKIQYRVMLSRYRGKTNCPDCGGTRLRKDAGYVKIGGKSISELVRISIKECADFFDELHLTEFDEKVARRLLIEIKNRLHYLCDVGLEYLTLNRLSNTLSGGESQRINLATSLGSSLVGSMYILDEPSIGLHPRDTRRLIGVLRALKDQGNTVIIVEHEEEVMRAADLLIDMGPEAGTHGGEVMFTGTMEQLMATGNTLTARYLNGSLAIEPNHKPKKGTDRIIIRGARENNLKNIDVEIPLRCFCVISGVSGSGKSTLVRDLLYPAIKRHLGGIADGIGQMDAIEGDLKTISAVEFVDQNPIGKSSRSNPVTYLKAYDEIRQLYSSQSISKQRGYKPSHFSFNVEGGRCDACEGEGVQTIGMQFMADVQLVCDVCKGKRFKEEILEVTYKGKSISDVLDMTVDDAIRFFLDDKSQTTVRNLIQKLEPLRQVGLGYIGLGQTSSSLSGGEAQRIKLASFLSKGTNEPHTVFIFDEPTTGLHFHDVKRLMDSFRLLLSNGHSIITIEHNLDVIRSADWLIDLGPEGGYGGGEVVYAGYPSDIRDAKKSYTGQFLAHKENKAALTKD
jgi:excinuclease ABC subunit A